MLARGDSEFEWSPTKPVSQPSDYILDLASFLRTVFPTFSVRGCSALVLVWTAEQRGGGRREGKREDERGRSQEEGEWGEGGGRRESTRASVLMGVQWCVRTCVVLHAVALCWAVGASLCLVSDCVFASANRHLATCHDQPPQPFQHR
eukprot:2554136-Rhodomonas_salina.1